MISLKTHLHLGEMSWYDPFSYLKRHMPSLLPDFSECQQKCVYIKPVLFPHRRQRKSSGRHQRKPMLLLWDRLFRAEPCQSAVAGQEEADSALPNMSICSMLQEVLKIMRNKSSKGAVQLYNEEVEIAATAFHPSAGLPSLSVFKA